MKHLILYDGTCPLCNRAVRFIIAHDKKKVFAFAPLEGETAKKNPLLKKLRELDTLVLIKNFNTDKKKFFIEGKGVLRIAWYLDGWYPFLGLLSFLPSLFFDFFYRFVAKRRFRFFKT